MTSHERPSWRLVALLVLPAFLFLSPVLASEAPTETTAETSAEAPAETSVASQAPETSEASAVETALERRAAMRSAAAERNDEQKREYLRAVVPNSAVDHLETDVIKMHSAREWYLLSYPTGTLPSQPWDKARGHVQRRVPDAAPWQGPGVPFRTPTAQREADGLSTVTGQAIVTPNENTWTAVGPLALDSVGTTNNAYTYGIVGGRVGAEALAVDPSNPSVAYAGFVAGGVWKTTNLGSANVTWTPLWDDKDFVTQAVSSITLDPNDPQTVYVGTGDWAATDQFSAGIMKSTDAGATWTQLGADVFTPFSTVLPAAGNRWSNQNIKTIAIDPKNSNTLLVGTRYDLYISHDAGSTWEICGFGADYTDPDPSTGPVNTVNRISDIVLDDRGTSTVAYVAVGYIAYNGNGNNGVYRFTVPTSGCPSWPADFETLFNGFPAGTGNGINTQDGGSLTGRIELASATGPDGNLTLYAQVGNADTLAVEGTYVLRPDGGSTTWTKLSGSTTRTECDGSAASTGQDWYDLFLAVDPTDDKTLFIGHIDAFKATVDSSYSSMSTTNLTNVYSTGCPEYGTVHPDQHAFAWVPGSGGTAFLVGNDGGVYYNGNSGDSLSWQQVNDDFNTHQFYGGQIGADFAGNGMNGVQWLFGGMQDNGNASWDSGTSDLTWTARSVGGDGFYTTFDPILGSLTSGFWITEYVYGDMYCSDTGAQGPYEGVNFFTGCGPNYQGSPDWSTPFMLDTLHCNTSSGCSNYLVGGDYAYAATGYSRGAPSWSRISGSLVKTASGSIITVNMAPSDPGAVAVGTNDGKVWWAPDAFQGSSCTLAAANTSSFSCSTNTSPSWVDADATNAVLPNRAVGQVAFDPSDSTRVYAAVLGFDENTPSTPGHLFELKYNGSGFVVTNKTGNLPNVPASSVAVNPHNPNQVFVGTYFGFYYTDDITASPVQWVRYQHGLPNTVIKHLTIDRGPASDPLLGTTLAAFTYGRGVFVLRLPVPSAVNQAPTASFTDSCSGLSCTFTDTSTDDGTIASWAWDFGDGSTSTAQNPSHTYGADGTYTVSLTVTDDGGLTDTASKSITVSSSTTNQAPAASFTESCTDLSCTFTDTSTDDGTIASWAWDFGDGSTSTAQNPSHTYGAGGTYTVSLTVTDDGGLTDTASKSVTVTAPTANITLSTNGYKVKGVHTIDLTWSGATSTNVDVYRDGSLVTTTANDGAYTDSTGNKGGGSYTYQVCEAGTSTCSNTSNVVY